MIHQANFQKSYLGQSANQILKSATIDVMAAGNVEIVHRDFPGCTFTRTDEGDLIIRDSFDLIVALRCGKRAAETLHDLAEQCETEQIRILKAQDKRDGTTYAERL